MSLLVSSGHGGLTALIFYAIALGICLLGLGARAASRRFALRTVKAIQHADIERIALPAMFVALQIAALAYFSNFRYHHVQDEFITAYTSLTLPDLRDIDWFAGYPAPGEWLARFPILFHILQRPFFTLLGPSVEAVRISTWPYQILTAVCLYVLASEIFSNRRWGAATAVVFVVLAPHLYLGGLGLHFISSTFFFTAAFTCFVLTLTRESRGFALLCGLFTVAAYLTYLSSYLALPLLLVFAVFITVRTRSSRPLQLLAPAIIVFAVGILPFAVHALTQDNYFTDRAEQVAVTEAEEEADSPATHLLMNIRALYGEDIGGVNDYWFGKRPLFDPLTLCLMLTGVTVAVFRGIVRREMFLPCIAVIIGATFLLGMVLTTPAGAFHRASLAFPFIALLIVLAIRTIATVVMRATKRPVPGTVLTILLIIGIVTTNVSASQRMIQEDVDIRPADSIYIAEFLEARVPDGSRILIAAFPLYHLERELTFRNGNAFTLETLQFEDALQAAEQRPIIVLDPAGWKIDRLRDRFPNGRVLYVLDGQPLERHAIFLP